jgi:hypothetical protein
MKRRNVILGLGSLSAAGAGVGTGAFSLGTVDRNADVTVANENNAYLAMAPSSGPNGNYATQGSNGNEIGLDFSGANNQNGSGVNGGGEFYFDNVFTVQNQGSQTLYVWVNFSGSTFDDSNLYLYPNGARDTELNDGSNSVLTLAPGENATIGVYIDTNSVSTGQQTPTMTVRADVDNPNPGNSDPVGPGGDEALVVSQDDNKGDFDTIQGAIDKASGTDILVQPGTYQEELDIPGGNSASDVQGLTLRSTQGPGQTTIEANAQNDNEAITIDGVSGVRIEGFEITFDGNQSPNAEKYGIRALAGSDGFTVADCTIGDFSTFEDGRDGSGGNDVDAVRSVGVTVTSETGSSAPQTVLNPVISDITFEEITCTGVTTDDSLDSDSKAKGVALNGDVRGARVQYCDFLSIGEASNDPSGAQISRPGNLAKGTDKPRGISIISGSANSGGSGPNTAPSNFIIKGNVFGGPLGSGDEIVGVFGQPAIFIGGSGGMGPNHNLKNNEFYHPVDNLNGTEALNLNDQNNWFNTDGTTHPLNPDLVQPDQDEDGGRIVQRGGSSAPNYDLSPPAP